MAASERSFPFDAENINGVYDREYVAEDFARYFKAFISSGVFMNESTNLQVIANGDMTVTLKPGNLIIDGYRYENEQDIIIQLDPADGVANRIDRISITWSKRDRDIHYTVQKGKSTYIPLAPEARRTAEYKDYVVADVYVAAGAILIKQSDITDVRLNSDLCGLAAAFCKIDTTTIFNQFSDWFNVIRNKGEKDIDKILESYDTWIVDLKEEQLQQCGELLDKMRDILSESAAARLQLEIDELTETLTEADRMLSQRLGDMTFVKCTQDEYDAMGSGRPSDTVYIIVG